MDRRTFGILCDMFLLLKIVKTIVDGVSRWEGSAHDGRVLRDAMIRSNGLKAPQGCYYLVDSGYCNADGFLAPFRGQRYYLNEFHGHRPHTAEEYFNMKHSKARNVIERCFGLLKGRWKILASPSFFPIETQVRIILACCLLHNLIRKYMSFDPQELEPFEEDDMEDEHFEDDEYVTSITPTEEWTNFRNSLALEMFNHWRKDCILDLLWARGYVKDFTHKKAKGMWDFKFPYLNQLELVYGRDRAIGVVVQGYVDAIYNLEVDQNDESGGENLGAFYPFSNEYEEDNNVHFESESTPTSSQNIDVTKSAKKRKQPLTARDKVARKKKLTAHLDIVTQLQDMNNGFHTFVDGFNANFATIANVMVEENLREKIASERMKDVIAELMNLGLPSGDVFKAANIFTADKDKIDVLFNLPSELRRNYVVSLLIPSPSM
ncbi:hypothetical protein ZIOFF_047638 [Zingiber officinale]|uniref:DDE Tnp4 domain-containing protein n=1 Tax=Zingiber officinale TaxID=94328 RepID=A0A8J5FNB5_ZINOF|nr:hypothetical protein ZIOFF_047638 [Zingiber officinale]